MTANTTEQERAEVRKAIESALDEVHIEDGTTYWFDRVIEDVTTAVMSTRRAPVVPVPQGLRDAAQRAHDWMERQQRQQSKGGHATFDMMMLREERDALAEALAAAPQPPEAAQLDDINVVDMAQAVDSKEAAPVQLPEPFTSLVRKKSWSPNCYEASPLSSAKDYGRQWADERINVYTEHQVLAILAQHGIKTK